MSTSAVIPSLRKPGDSSSAIVVSTCLAVLVASVDLVATGAIRATWPGMILPGKSWPLMLAR